METPFVVAACGASTGRYCSAIVDGPESAVVPLNHRLVRYRFSATGTPFVSIVADSLHEEVIVSCMASPDGRWIATAASNGQVVLFDSAHSWRRVSSCATPFADVLRCSWEEQGALLVVAHNHAPGFAVVAFDVHALQLRCVKAVDALERPVFVELLSVSVAFVWDAVDRPQMRLFDWCANATIKSREMSAGDVLSCGVRAGTHIALSLNGRRIVIVDSASLDTVRTLMPPGSGAYIKAFTFDHSGQLIVPSDDGSVALLRVDPPSDAAAPPPPTVRNCWTAGGPAYCVAAAAEGVAACFVSTGDAVVWVDFTRGTALSHSHHSLPIAGIAVHPRGDIFGAGDLAGGVSVFGTQSCERIASTHTGGLPVRCMRWCGDVLLIGSLSECILAWRPSREAVVPWAVTQTSGGVTCMDLCRTTLRIAAGTTQGLVYVLDGGSGDSFPVLFSFAAHIARVQHDPHLAFGSLPLFAECWSLRWSPDGGHIITGSEDQSSCVYRISADHGATLERTLRVHTSAVTCVDWNDDFVVSVGDDKLIYVWTSSTMDVHWRTSTADVLKGWHTLTYCALARHLLCVCTQNGFLLVYDLQRKCCVHRRKHHLASIEGISIVNDEILATSCSSSTVNIASLRALLTAPAL